MSGRHRSAMFNNLLILGLLVCGSGLKAQQRTQTQRPQALLAGNRSSTQVENWHWASAWGTAVHSPIPFPGFPSSPTFENQTIRMVVRPTIAGPRLRLRVSNEFGISALSIGAIHIALTDEGGSIVQASDRTLTFGGQKSVDIPPGALLLSDPVDFEVKPFREVSVSLYLPKKVAASTVHFWAQHESYIAGPGDVTSQAELPNATRSISWFWLSDIEVWSTNQTSALVAFGDSITDGIGAKPGEYGDWPDLLAKRLAESSTAPSIAVINEGIGANRLLHDGGGVNALARLDRDVLAKPGIANLIILEGTNDIGWPVGKFRLGPPFPDPATEAVSADQIILALRQIIVRAHEHQIRVFLATLTPIEGTDTFTPDTELMRQKVNSWIRKGEDSDGVIDFDAAVRDPNHPSQIRADLQQGDHLHPNTAGYKAMANGIDLSLLQKKPGVD